MEWPPSYSSSEGHLQGYSTFPQAFPQQEFSAILVDPFSATSMPLHPSLELDDCVQYGGTSLPRVWNPDNNADPTTGLLSPTLCSAKPQSPLSVQTPHNDVSTPDLLLQKSNNPNLAVSDLEQKTKKASRTAERSPNLNTTPSFQCKWQGCTYTGSFGREAELIRHLKNVHISPGAHLCIVDDCERVFNRKDNLHQHMKRLHHLG